MTDERNPHSGGYFDDFLAEQGMLDDVTEHATKAVLAWQIEQEMCRQGLTKKAMAERMGTSRSQLDRVLDAHSDAVQLDTLKKAAAVLGKRIRIELVDAA